MATEDTREPGPGGRPAAEEADASGNGEGGTPPAGAPEGAHRSLEAHVPTTEAVERVWRAYWLPMLLGSDGKISTAKLKGELYDSWFLVNEARRVYRHVTGGVTDALTASADGIIAMADRQIERREEKLKERIAELELVIRRHASAELASLARIGTDV